MGRSDVTFNQINLFGAKIGVGWVLEPPKKIVLEKNLGGVGSPNPGNPQKGSVVLLNLMHLVPEEPVGSVV